MGALATLTHGVGFGRYLGNYGQGELLPDEVFALTMKVNQPRVETVTRIEAATGKPVVTSNQAMVFALCKALDLPRPKGAPGRLFDRL